MQNELRWSVVVNIPCIEEFRCGSLLFRLFPTIGWKITGPPDVLEEYAVALERDLEQKKE